MPVNMAPGNAAARVGKGGRAQSLPEGEIASDVSLAFAVARRWPGVLSNALEPGWVPTKMGGSGAPDSLALGHVTQAWLAVSEDAAARVTGGYFYHQKPRRVSAAASRVDLQDRLLDCCRDLTGVEIR